MLVDPENPPSRQASDRAADGAPLAPAANSLSDLIRFLEDGQLNADATVALKELNSDMCNAAIESGGKSKGKLVLTLDFSLEGNVFSIASKFKTDVPESKRPKSVMWATQDGRFTPHNPRQTELFGMREVRGTGGGGGFRDAS